MNGSAPAQLRQAVPLVGHRPQLVRVALAVLSDRRPILTKTIAWSSASGPPEQRTPPVHPEADSAQGSLLQRGAFHELFRDSRQRERYVHSGFPRLAGHTCPRVANRESLSLRARPHRQGRSAPVGLGLPTCIRRRRLHSRAEMTFDLLEADHDRELPETVAGNDLYRMVRFAAHDAISWTNGSSFVRLRSPFSPYAAVMPPRS